MLLIRVLQLFRHLKRDHGINHPDKSKIALYNSGPEDLRLKKLFSKTGGTVDKSVSVIGYLDGRLFLPQCPDMFLADLIGQFPHIMSMIFEYLDDRSLMRNRQVCKLWKKFIDE